MFTIIRPTDSITITVDNTVLYVTVKHIAHTQNIVKNPVKV